MKNNTAFVLLLFISTVLLASDGLKTVKKIKFTGFNSYTSAEFIFKSGIRIRNGLVVYEENRLKKVLDSEKLIENYKLIDLKDTLNISVREIENVKNILLITKSGNRLIIVNSENEALSVDKIVKNEPVIIINEKFKKSSNFSKKLIAKLELLSIIRKESGLYSQLKQIYLHDSYMEVICFGRRTRFFLGNKESDFEKLRNTLGYLDKIGYYPEEMNLNTRMTVVK